MDASFRAIFDHAAVGIALHDMEGLILEANPAFQQLTGYTADELRSMRASALSPPEEAAVTRDAVRELKAGVRDVVQVEKQFVRKDSSMILCELTVSRVEGPDGMIGMVGMLVDITERRRIESELAYRARHDVLTGLANRTTFGERVDAALTQADGRRDMVAVLYIDLDEFKAVNDSFGHGPGDLLLCQVAERLLDATRGSDVVARLGGDEFAVLLQNVRNEPDVTIVAGRIATALQRPFQIDGAEIVVAASVGIARATDDDGVAEILRNADLAMYRAKQHGRGGYELYVPEMHDSARERLELESDLRHALVNHELHLVYQPIVEITNARLIGIECLIRWEHPARGLLLPADFIPAAERSGLIIPIGRWVLREACRQGARWLQMGVISGTATELTQDTAARDAPSLHAPAFTITVNVSGRQLADDRLVDDVAAALAEFDFDPRCLVLEITESVIMQDTEPTLAKLHALKALGVRLAIDDFGTGYSSLSYLRRFPIDVLKIDKGFVDGLTRGGPDAALARTIIALGDMLSLRTIAEGVETAAQRTHLADLGCELGQGYLFAHPLQDAEIDRLLLPSAPV